jgi:hypothetical protein
VPECVLKFDAVLGGIGVPPSLPKAAEAVEVTSPPIARHLFGRLTYGDSQFDPFGFISNP